jgi:hypothetical protein
VAFQSSDSPNHPPIEAEEGTDNHTLNTRGQRYVPLDIRIRAARQQHRAFGEDGPIVAIAVALLVQTLLLSLTT